MEEPAAAEAAARKHGQTEKEKMSQFIFQQMQKYEASHYEASQKKTFHQFLEENADKQAPVCDVNTFHSLRIKPGHLPLTRAPDALLYESNGVSALREILIHILNCGD